MGVQLLLLSVICQTVITATLGGVTLPFSDSKGKVTPIKPKTLPALAVSSSVTKSTLKCDSKDTTPNSFPAAATKSVTREFSSPLTFTSSSRALPVPKIDSSSIENVKIPEKLREKFLSLCKAPVTNAKTDSLSPEVSLPYKYPFLSSSTKLSNASPCNFLPDMHTAPLNILSSLPNINSLPNVPVKSLQQNSLFSSSFKGNQFSASPTIKSSSSGVLDSPKTLETRTPSFSEQFTPNTLPLSAPCSSPHPLHFKSTFLPGVKTPSESLSYRPLSYKNARNFNIPSQSSSHNLYSPKTLISDNILNPLPHTNEPYASPYLNSIKASQILKPINPIQLPKSPSNIPISTKTVSSAQNAVIHNIWPQANANSASVAFESTLETPESEEKFRRDQDSLSSLPYLWARGTSDIKLQPCTPPVIKPPAFTPPKTIPNPQKTPLVPISPSSPIFDVLSNRISCFDCSNLDTPDVVPMLGLWTESIEKANPNNLRSNYQTCFNTKQTNLNSLSSNQQLSFTRECVPFKYSPPIIPTESIPTIYSATSSYSPVTNFPPRIAQTTPVSYINQSPTSSISQTASNMVSSITNLISNIVQNILSSYKSCIYSAPQNIPQTRTYTTQSDPYADVMLKPEETVSVLSVVPFPQGNPVNTISILPIVNAPIDCINAQVPDSSTVKSLETPCQSSAFEVTSSQPVLMSSPPQPITTILPPTSLITFPSPQICPSYLPSPTLPSYSAISSPFYMEAPVFKKKSSKKESDMEKMIELMLLAEILNNDESFDWDDLDTLLAFLSIS